MIDMPPVWLLIFLIAAYVQSVVFNPLGYQGRIWDGLGVGLILAGIALELSSALQFRRHMTTLVPRNTPKAMITSGPFSFSRNPIYLANCIILAGAVLLDGSVVGFLLIPAYMTVITYRFIIGEEAGLEGEFGAAFRDYKQNTRRWI